MVCVGFVEGLKAAYAGEPRWGKAYDAMRPAFQRLVSLFEKEKLSWMVPTLHEWTLSMRICAGKADDERKDKSSPHK